MKILPLPDALLLRSATLLLSATTHAQVPRRYPAATTPAAGNTPSLSQPHNLPLGPAPAPRYAAAGTRPACTAPIGLTAPVCDPTLAAGVV